MLKNKNAGRVLAYPLLALTILIAVLSFVIKTTYRINTIAEIFPKEKWLITRGGNGEIISNHIDYTQGRTKAYSIANFERGEFVGLDLGLRLEGKKEISRGDTIVLMKSSNLREQMTAAVAQLEIAVADLRSQKSPAKTSLIKEAENKLAYCAQKIAEQKLLFERVNQLHSKGFSSQEEYDKSKSALALCEIEYKVNEAVLENLRTGVKPEEITLLESQINAAKVRIDELRNRESQFTLVAPFSGALIPSFSPDTLLYAANYSMIVLHLPVRVADLSELAEGKEFPIESAADGLLARGTILTIGKDVKIVNGKQAVFVSMLAENTNAALLPGMILPCAVKLGTISFFDYLLRMAVH